MGRGVSWGARPPSTTTYFVALGGIVVLLALLCLYCLYFCFTRVKELSREELASQTPATTSYPVQPGVREGAQAMVQMCRQLPIARARAADVASPSTHDTSVASHTTNDVSVTSQSHSTQDSCISSRDVHDGRVASTSQPAVSQAIDDANATPMDAEAAALASVVSQDNRINAKSLRNSFLFQTDRTQGESIPRINWLANDDSSQLAGRLPRDVRVPSQQNEDKKVSFQPRHANLSSETNNASVLSQTLYDDSVSSSPLDDAALPYDLAASILTAPAAITTVK